MPSPITCERCRKTPALRPCALFEQARRLVQWHYQWIIVNEFLPLTVGKDRVRALLRDGTKFYAVESARENDGGYDGHAAALAPLTPRSSGRRAAPMIPVEFSAAAYRFGHSQVRPSYRLNFGPVSGGEFFAFVFDDSQDPTAGDPKTCAAAFARPVALSTGRPSSTSATATSGRTSGSTPRSRAS